MNNQPQCDFCATEKQFYKPATWRIQFWLSDIAFLTPGEKDVLCERNACDRCAVTREKLRLLTSSTAEA